MLHWGEFIVSSSALVSLCLTILFVIAFHMLWRSVSLRSCCFFSILFRYHGQGSITFVVPVIDLLFLSCHEVLLFNFVCVHISIVILILISHLILIVWVDIIVDLCFDLLMNHSIRALLIASIWPDFLVFMCKAIAFVVLNFNGADVSSLILFSAMFVFAKVAFA